MAAVRRRPRLLQDFEPNVLATFPAPCKAYPAGLPTVAMPREWPASGSSTTAVLAGRHAAAASPNLARLARVLHLSSGVVRVAERDDGRRFLFRAAGSAGGRFPPRSTSRPAASRVSRTVSTGSTRRTTPSSRSVRRRKVKRRRSSSQAFPGGPAGAIRSAGTGTSTGTPGRCWRRRSRWRTTAAWRRDFAPSSPTPP